MEFNLKGQTAVVTGGTRGIGRGVSEALLKAGAKVVATYQSNGKAAKEFLESRKEYLDYLDLRQFDVTKYTQVEDFFRYIEETYGEFQILVHCSGIRIDSVVGMMNESDWHKVIDTNLTGTFNICKFAVQNMMRKKYGRIIIITSPIGKFGFLGQSNYAASKAGQVAFMKSLSKEVASRKITVNCVSPGFIQSKMTDNIVESIKAVLTSRIPMSKLGTGEDVSNTVAFLSSDAASYITGQTIHVNGGMYMG